MHRSSLLGRLVLLLALLLGGCANTSQTSTPTAAPAPTRSRPTPLPTPAAGQFANPVINQDFPDPDTLKVGETYYAYATNSGGTNIPLARSPDLIAWQPLGEALPALPAWAEAGFTWAPEASALPDGRVVLYFTAREAQSQRQCIGAATAATAAGPFVPVGDQPLICQREQGGSIDPATFTDSDGTRYLLWKNDGNCCGHDTWLYIQRSAPDGLTLEGQPTRLIKQDQGWEGRLIEAPTLWKHTNRYYLFYSANTYAGADYAVGYAVADQLLGPYRKSPQPLLQTSTKGGVVIGPGGQDVQIGPDGTTWMIYHSWDLSLSYRTLSIDRLEWQAGRPVVRGPSRVPQPLPAGGQ